MKITNVTPWIITGPGENPGAYVLPNRSDTRQYVFVQVEPAVVRSGDDRSDLTHRQWDRRFPAVAQ